MPRVRPWMEERPTLAGALLYPMAVALVIGMTVAAFFVVGLMALIIGLSGVFILLLAASWLGPYWAAKWSTTGVLRGVGRGALTHALGVCMAFPIYDLALPDESPGFLGRFAEFAFIWTVVGLPVALIAGAKGGRAGGRMARAARIAPVYPESMNLLSTEVRADDERKP